MASRVYWLAVVALATLIAPTGCPKQTAMPSWLSGVHEGYPSAGYVVGTGRSDESYAEAEAAARAEVARQITSEIEVLVEREAEVIKEGDRVRAHSFVAQVIRERSTFEHAELIRTPDDGRYADRDGFWAFACLSRRDADEALAIEQGQIEDQLGDLRERIVGAAADGDPARLSQVVASFREAHDQWDVLRFQRRAIAGGEGGATLLADGMATDVVAALGQLQDRIVWVVRVESASPSVPDAAVEAAEQVLVEALSSLGTTAMLAERAPCREPTGDRDLSYGLTAQVDVQQTLGQIGPKAVIDLTVEGEACHGSANALFTHTLPGFIGVHSTRKDRALDIAVGKLRDGFDRIEADLAAPIGDVVPLP